MSLAPLVYQRCIVTLAGCVEWTGGVTGSGYGNLQLPNREQHTTHIVTWEAVHGPVPDDLVLDHVVCANKRCCLPSHLTPRPRGENVLRDSTHPNHIAYRTNRCPRDHSLDDAYIRPNGRRMCRTCQQLRDRRRRARE